MIRERQPLGTVIDARHQAALKYLKAYNACTVAKVSVDRLDAENKVRPLTTGIYGPVLDDNGQLTPLGKAASHKGRAFMLASLGGVMLLMGSQIGADFAILSPVAQGVSAVVLGSAPGLVLWASVNSWKQGSTELEALKSAKNDGPTIDRSMRKEIDETFRLRTKDLNEAGRTLQRYTGKLEPEKLVAKAKELVAQDAVAQRELLASEKALTSTPDFTPPLY